MDKDNKDINYRENYTKYDYLCEFLIEALEILVLYIVYHIVTSTKNLDYYKSIKIALFISAFSNLLEWYNPILRKNMKTGILVNMGSAFIKMH